MYSFPNFEPVCCSMSGSNCCFLTHIQVSQETGKMVWYSHLFKNLPQCVVIHTVKGVSIINETEVDISLEFPCFRYDQMDVGNLISGASAFSMSIWKSSNFWSLSWRINHFYNVFYWSVVDLLCCVNFCCITVIHYTHTFFFIFFSMMVYHGILNIWFPVLYSRNFLFIHPIYNSLHLLTPNSQFIPSIPLSLLATTSVFSMSVNLFLLSR